MSSVAEVEIVGGVDDDLVRILEDGVGGKAAVALRARGAGAVAGVDGDDLSGGVDFEDDLKLLVGDVEVALAIESDTARPAEGEVGGELVSGGEIVGRARSRRRRRW